MAKIYLLLHHQDAQRIDLNTFTENTEWTCMQIW